ncbi:MAG: exosortase/archaeosortase family protein [Planctomycetota bacterium]|jgi:exosortase
MPDNIVSSIADRPNSTKNPKKGIQKQASNKDNPLRNQSQNSNRARTSWPDLGGHNYLKIMIITGLFVYLFRDETGRIVLRWLNDSSWSHGFLIPLFSLYFINQHKKEILSLTTRPNYLGLLFLICGIVFYALNGASPSGYAYLQPISMIAVLGAVVLFLGGWRLVKYTWLPIAFLVFAVPLPRRYYVAFTMPMRHLAAEIAATLLNLLSGLEATANGVIIDVIYRNQHLEPLNVAEACSGMRLLMAFLALGVAMAYLHYRPTWQRIILLASTIPIAILCNIVRVTVTGFIYVLIHPKYTQGIYHDILGLGMLPLAFVLYGFLAWFMASLFVEESKTIAEDIIVRSKH